MTRDDVLMRLETARAVFDEKLAAVPPDALDAPVPGSPHTVKEIVAHVTSYDELIVERLIAARHGATTGFDRDRVGWEAFNERTWREASATRTEDVLDRAHNVFDALLHEVSQLSDEELAAPAGATAALDPAWLDGRAPWAMIGIDAFEHYPMHYAALDAAAAGLSG